MWPTPPGQDSYEYFLKIIVVGDSSVGKSCLLLRYSDKKYRMSHEVTVGVEFGSRIVEREGIRFKTHVWDTAGQETFRSVTRAYYRTAAVALMVFDVTRRRTFEHVRQWATDVQSYAAPNVVLALVANKTDLQEERDVSREEAETFAAELGALYFETSAKDASGVDDAFVSPCIVAIRRLADTPMSAVHRIEQSVVKDATCCHR